MLEYAATNGQTDVLAFLVDAGLDVNRASLHDTPLSATARVGTVETAQWLLDHGADVNAKVEPRGATPLHTAVEEGRLEMVRLLLERGANPDILHGNPQRNALAAARFWGHDDVAEFLESQGIVEIVIETTSVDVEAPGFSDPAGVSNPATWLDAKWPHVYEYVLTHGLASMSEKNQVLFLVGYLIEQLADGGTVMLYSNPSAKYAPDMAIALDKIGAKRAAQTIHELNALFPGGAPAKDDELRTEQLESLPPQASRLAEALEAVFDERQPEGERVVVAQLYNFYYF